MAILYITQQGAARHKSGNQVIVKKGREVLQEIPIVHLNEVVIFQPKHGHAALASDLMEEFRQVIVDGYVLSLVNRNRVQLDDFEKTDKGIRFTKTALDRFLTGYYGRMQQAFQHPTRNEKTTYLRAIELQVRHLARVIMEEESVYKPFRVRA